jgi:hypothetical protein
MDNPSGGSANARNNETHEKGPERAGGRDIPDMTPDEMAAEIIRLRDQLLAHSSIEQARTALSRAIYHDLKSPINTIISCIDVVFEGAAGELNKQQKDFLKKAENGLYRLASYVERLMELCKIESNLFSQNPDDILVGETLAPLVEAAKVGAQEKNIAISLEIEELLPSIRIDKISLDHIMQNLISNAVKYTTEGGAVKVSAGRRGDCVAIRVADTGVGISEKDLSNLFEPFFRAGAAGTRQEGTGLGLSVAKMIADVCGGKIEVKSEVGRGSEFSFIIPVNAADS